MTTLPNRGREWLKLAALALKVGVGVGIPAVVLYHVVLNQPGMFPHAVNMETKALAVPVQTGCVVACALLLAATVVELFWRQYKRALWDFAFAVLALCCWSLCAGLTVSSDDDEGLP